MKRLIPLLLLLAPLLAHADTSATVYQSTVKAAFERVYQAVYQSLESDRFFVVFEPDVGANMARFAEAWGEDYNRNKLDHIRSMAFCNIGWTNRISNADPNMLALCPLHVTLIHKGGMTTVLFARPDAIAKGSPAEAAAAALTADVIKAIDRALERVQGE